MVRKTKKKPKQETHTSGLTRGSLQGSRVTDFRNEESERAERRMKRQKEQGSESVDDNPWPHAS
ncbi:MAG: hypothetical protein DMG43_16510 [Acidobacteria bacterium]|nr:MAG: hypothetical protein DMG43_16510 [Acidobacteriota bacterium]